LQILAGTPPRVWALLEYCYFAPSEHPPLLGALIPMLFFGVQTLCRTSNVMQKNPLIGGVMVIQFGIDE
jgi:hypothetical protein